MKYNIAHVFSVVMILVSFFMIVSSLFVFFNISRLDEPPEIIEQIVGFYYRAVTDFPSWSELKAYTPVHLAGRSIINIVGGVALLIVSLRIYKRLNNSNR